MGVLYYLSFVSGLIPFILGLVLFRKLNLALKSLLLLFGIGLLIEALGYYLYFFTKIQNNIWLYHFYTLIECSLFIFIFSFWQNDFKLKRILRIIIPGFAFLWIGAKIFFESFDQPDNYTTSLECVLLVAISFRTLYVVDQEHLKTIFREPRFWISAAVLIYFSANLVTFALGNMIVNWGLHHAVINIIANLLYAGGFLCLCPRLSYGGLLSSAL